MTIKVSVAHFVRFTTYNSTPGMISTYYGSVSHRLSGPRSPVPKLRPVLSDRHGQHKIFTTNASLFTYFFCGGFFIDPGSVQLVNTDYKLAYNS